ncbi:MAG TPA: FAD-binding oxidoreductase [Chloroflexi bacterium]|nr:FAD-binding oxidoreductase [Chloroflexota bacterium]HHW84995.1 FAD-binding protein [Chloroflexota bacterium]
MNHAHLVHALQAIVGADAVLATPDAKLVYTYDASFDVHMPDVVALPTTTAQVSQIAQLAAKERIPLVARGAGTGLSGGALPLHGGILLVLTRMRTIRSVDAGNRRAVVEAGVVNQQLVTAANQVGLTYAPDPGSGRTSTIGGNIASNAGGPHCLAHGVTLNHVVGLTVVLSDGAVVQTGSALADAYGYDLTGVLVGAEGTLGIVTEATVQLMPQAEAVRTLLVAFPTIEDASAAVSAVIAAGIVPTAMEMMDGKVCRAVEAAVHAGYPTDVGGVLLIEVESVADGLDAVMARIADICRAHRAGEVRRATTAAERAALWLGRKSALGAMGRIAPSYFLEDGVVPRHRLPEVMAFVEEAATRHQLPIGNFFHAGDGNIHPTILFDRRNQDAVARAQLAATEILEKCVEVGGVVSGEHGIGTEKQNYMALLYTQDDLDAMWEVKLSFDPAAQLNPGKIFPRFYQPGAPANHLPPTPADAAHNGHSPAVILHKMRSDDALATAFARLVGADAVATTDAAAYAVGDRQPRLVVRPGSVEETAAVLRYANEQRLHVTPVGGNTCRHLGGALAGYDLALSLERLHAIEAHYPSDLTLAVQAGATLAAVNAALATTGQMLPLDAPLAGRATLGGIVAAGAPVTGLRRLAYGTARDLLLGVQVVRADGRSFRRGRMVVKNVAGYDLARLQYGALGALGVLTALIFKLQPLPETSAAVIAAFATPQDADGVVQRLLRSRLQPAAVLLLDAALDPTPSAAQSLRRWRLLVRFDGRSAAVERQVNEVAAWMQDANGAAIATIEAHALEACWPMLTDFSQMAACGAQEWLLRVNVRAVDTAAALTELTAACATDGLGVTTLADAASGVIWLRLTGAETRVTQRLAHWRRRWPQTIVAAAPNGCDASLDRWGAAPSALTVMQRLKQRFDPHGILNYGRDLVSASLLHADAQTTTPAHMTGMEVLHVN